MAACECEQPHQAHPGELREAPAAGSEGCQPGAAVPTCHRRGGGQRGQEVAFTAFRLRFDERGLRLLCWAAAASHSAEALGSGRPWRCRAAQQDIAKRRAPSASLCAFAPAQAAGLCSATPCANSRYRRPSAPRSRCGQAEASHRPGPAAPGCRPGEAEASGRRRREAAGRQRGQEEARRWLCQALSRWELEALHRSGAAD